MSEFEYIHFLLLQTFKNTIRFSEISLFGFASGLFGLIFAYVLFRHIFGEAEARKDLFKDLIKFLIFLTFTILIFFWEIIHTSYEVYNEKSKTESPITSKVISTVSVRFTESAPEFSFAITDLPRPHVYIKIPFEISNQTNETKFATISFSEKNRFWPKDWNIVEQNILPVGGDSVKQLDSGKLKLPGNDAYLFYINLQLETSDQRKKDFGQTLKNLEKLEGELLVKLDTKEVISTEKEFEIKNIAFEKWQLDLAGYYKAFPDLQKNKDSTME